jgi:hypothetical protein
MRVRQTRSNLHIVRVAVNKAILGFGSDKISKQSMLNLDQSTKKYDDYVAEYTVEVNESPFHSEY